MNQEIEVFKFVILFSSQDDNMDAMLSDEEYVCSSSPASESIEDNPEDDDMWKVLEFW